MHQSNLDDDIYDRHSVFKKLYPLIFSEFEKRTNEKQRIKKYLSESLQSCFHKHPTFFSSDCFKIYDMGVGSGQILVHLLQDARKILPPSTRHFAYGVDNKEEFVLRSCSEVEKIADQTSIALGDLQDDISKYQLLDGQFARHDRIHDINVILLSHVCYYINDVNCMQKIVGEMLQLSSQTLSPLFCFVHLSADTVISDMLMEKEFSFLKPRKKDPQEKILMALQNEKIPFLQASFDTQLYFPEVTDDQWEKLSSSLLSFSQYDFNGELQTIDCLPLEMQNIWKLILLWTQDAFAVFNKQERMLIIDRFKGLISKYPEGIPLPNTIIFASPDSTILKAALAKSD
jgi:hypothetical protein